MRKLHLHLEDLAVETFDPTAPRAAGGGTVRGHDGPSDTTCYDRFCTCPTAASDCGSCETDAITCAPTCFENIRTASPTCGYSCEGTCEGETCDDCWIIR